MSRTAPTVLSDQLSDAQIYADTAAMTTADTSHALLDTLRQLDTDLSDMPSADPRFVGRRLPPLTKWSPERITPFDVVIEDDGQWRHEGSIITRQSLVDLFSSVLWAENIDGKKRHYLKTPTDKYEITVIDTPLFINDVERVMTDKGAVLVFGTRHGDKVTLSDAHPLYFADFVGKYGVEERLYIDLYHGLSARIERSVLHHLVNMGELDETDGQVRLRLVSAEQVFELVSRSLAD